MIERKKGMNKEKTNVEAAGVPKEKMDKGSAFGYATGSMGISIIWYMINNYLMLFYTDVVGLTAGAISLIMLIARIWDAANDPMMGAIVDRTHTKWGKFKPYLAIGAPFLAIFNILTYTVWPLEGTAKVAVCLLCYIGVGMAYTVLQVAANGIINRLSNDSQIKLDIVSIGQVATAIINTILGACAMPLILYFSKSDVANGTGYFRATIIFSVVAVPMVWIMAAKCKEVEDPETRKVLSGEKAEKKPLMKSLKALMKNKMLLICVVMVFVGAVSQIARMSLLSYYLIYVAGAYAYIAPTFTTISLLQIAGNMILPMATRKFGKIRWFVGTLIVNSLSIIVLFFAPAGNIPILLICSGIYGLTNSATSICFGMLCDTIEYGDYMYGVRDDALAFSLQSFGVKIAQALTGSVAVLLLAAIGYQAGMDQTEATKQGINFIVNLAPAILCLISLIPMRWYTLDEKRMEEISAELVKRRAGETE